jgi:carboxypeptidase C (cathepsin A)
MKFALPTLLLALCLTLTLSSLIHPMKRGNLGDSVNPVNPKYNYPEQTEVDPSTLSIPYAAKFNTGYITVNNNTQSKLFYVLYPAGGAKDASAGFDNNAPLILWLQGGPGCSDGTGNYGEIGPFTIDLQSGKLTPVTQNFNWNEKYNLLFVDSPVGVGFSVSGNEKPNNAMDTVRYLQIFLIRFFQVYSSLKKNDFYIFGESYAGHYIPALSTVIVQNNTNNGIRLRGIGVGDGWTDAYIQLASFSEYAFATSNLDDRSRNQVVTYEHDAREAIKAGDYSKGTELFDKLTEYITDLNYGVSPYNFEVYDGEEDHYPDWLNTANVKKAYGVDPAVTFKDCVDQVYTDFYPDIATSYLGNYSYLLTQKVIPDFRVILYSGQNDIIVNTVGSYNFIKAIDWSGNAGFIASKKKLLKGTDGAVIGNYKNYKALTFAVIYDAGHMVPTDQPNSAKTMLDKFIQNQFSSSESIEEISV